MIAITRMSSLSEVENGLDPTLERVQPQPHLTGVAAGVFHMPH
jgi:hypothetical protein